jgi:hypothetical protein
MKLIYIIFAVISFLLGYGLSKITAPTEKELINEYFEEIGK